MNSQALKGPSVTMKGITPTDIRERWSINGNLSFPTDRTGGNRRQRKRCIEGWKTYLNAMNPKTPTGKLPTILRFCALDLMQPVAKSDTGYRRDTRGGEGGEIVTQVS